jgi:hypothetical protein
LTRDPYRHCFTRKLTLLLLLLMLLVRLLLLCVD